MNAIAYVQRHLCDGTVIGWLIPVVHALGPSGKSAAIGWVRESLFELLPRTEDEWLRNVMESELELIGSYEDNLPSHEELENRSEHLHQIPHEGAQPAVHNLLIAFANNQFRSDNQCVVNLEASLRLVLEAAGNSEENRNVVIVQLCKTASDLNIDLESCKMQRNG